MIEPLAQTIPPHFISVRESLPTLGIYLVEFAATQGPNLAMGNGILATHKFGQCKKLPGRLRELWLQGARCLVHVIECDSAQDALLGEACLRWLIGQRPPAVVLGLDHCWLTDEDLDLIRSIRSLPELGAHVLRQLERNREREGLSTACVNPDSSPLSAQALQGVSGVPSARCEP